METGAIEAYSLRTFDIRLEFSIAGSCPDTIRIESLVKYKTQENRLIVEKELVAFNVEIA